MSFLSLFPNGQERRLAYEEAAAALEKYGDKAAAVLLMKAQQSQSSTRRTVYKLARKIVLKSA
jgi:oligoendopeptidase F